MTRNRWLPWEPIALTVLAVVLVLSGQASYYADGVMDEVWAYRSTYMQPCDECLGFVAMVEPGRLGARVWLRPAGGKWSGPYLVIDCARAEDRAGTLAPALRSGASAGVYAAGRIVEVSRELARAWGMQGPVGVDLAFENPLAVREWRLELAE